MDRVNIHGVNISNITIREAVEKIQEWISSHSAYSNFSEILPSKLRSSEISDNT
jgi:UDP-N-acetyl-D-mannosaminuronic acid transferase (WecB/TagA/CpsF family)